MTWIDRSSGSIEGHLPFKPGVQQPAMISGEDYNRLRFKLKAVMDDARFLNERSCLLHLKFALSAVRPFRKK